MKKPDHISDLGWHLASSVEIPFQSPVPHKCMQSQMITICINMLDTSVPKIWALI